MLNTEETTFIAKVTKQPEQNINMLQRSRLQKIANLLKQRLGYAAFKVKQGMAHLSLEAVDAAWGNPDFLAAQSMFAISNPPVQHARQKVPYRRQRYAQPQEQGHSIDAVEIAGSIPAIFSVSAETIVEEEDEAQDVLRLTKRYKSISPQESPQWKKAKVKTPEVDARAIRSANRSRAQDHDEGVDMEEFERQFTDQKASFEEEFKEAQRQDAKEQEEMRLEDPKDVAKLIISKSAEEQDGRDQELKKFETEYQMKKNEFIEEQESLQRARNAHLQKTHTLLLQQRGRVQAYSTIQMAQIQQQRQNQESVTNEMQMHRRREAQLNNSSGVLPQRQFRQPQSNHTPEMIQINHQRLLSNQRLAELQMMQQHPQTGPQSLPHSQGHPHSQPHSQGHSQSHPHPQTQTYTQQMRSLAPNAPALGRPRSNSSTMSQQQSIKYPSYNSSHSSQFYANTPSRPMSSQLLSMPPNTTRITPPSASAQDKL